MPVGLQNLPGFQRLKEWAYATPLQADSNTAAKAQVVQTASPLANNVNQFAFGGGAQRGSGSKRWSSLLRAKVESSIGRTPLLNDSHASLHC